MILSLKFVLFFFNLSGWFALLNKFLKNYFQSIVLFQGLWITVGFIATIFGFLESIYFAFMIIGFASAIFFTYQSIQQRKASIIFPSEFVYLSILCFFWLIYFKNNYFYHFDVLHLWGIRIKELDLFNGLTPAKLVLRKFIDYPNGSAVYHYLYTKFFGYSEGIALFSHSALYTMLCSFALLKKGRHLASSFLIFVMISISVNFTAGFGTLMNDHIVGAFFGSLLVIIYQEYKQPQKLIFFFPIIFALTTVKHAGYTLSFLSSILLVLLVFKNKLYSAKHCIVLTSLFCIPMIVEATWAYLVVQKYFQRIEPISFYNKLNSIYSNYDHSLATYVLKNFTIFSLKVLFTKTASLILLVIILINYLAAKKYHPRILSDFHYLLTACAIIFLMYISHRVIIYLSVAKGWAIGIGGAQRYLSSVLIGLSSLMVYFLRLQFSLLTNTQYEKIKKLISVLLAIIFISFAPRLHKQFSSISDTRASAIEHSKKIYPLLNKGKKVFIDLSKFTNLTKGDYHESFLFELTPYINLTNLRKPLDKVSSKQSLKKYDYLYTIPSNGENKSSYAHSNKGSIYTLQNGEIIRK